MNYFKLITSLFICVGLGSLGGIFTSGEINTWYATLEKPAINPPGWIFGPVWTLLYILMGLSLYFFWNEKLPVVKADLHQVKIISKKKGYLYFGAQLLLNFLWSYFFFKLHSPFLAFVDILLLIAAIVLTMFHFNKVTAKAALILIPYLLWVCFATYLNFSIIRLN